MSTWCYSHLLGSRANCLAACLNTSMFDNRNMAHPIYLYVNWDIYLNLVLVGNLQLLH